MMSDIWRISECSLYNHEEEIYMDLFKPKETTQVGTNIGLAEQQGGYLWNTQYIAEFS